MEERFTLRSAVYLIPKRNGKVLLSRRYNTGWMDGKYSLIAGHLDGKESVSKAMIREAYEEAGIKIKLEDLIPAHVMHRYSSDTEYIDFFYLVKKWGGEPEIKEPHKSDKMEWFDLDNLPKNLLPYIKTALENYSKAIPFSEVGWEE